MVCGNSNKNISFNQFYIFGYFNSLPPCLSFWLSFLLFITVNLTISCELYIVSLATRLLSIVICCIYQIAFALSIFWT